MSSATNIKAAVITKLEGISSISTVFGYETSNFDGNYPVANVRMLNGEGEIRANTRNLVTYRFQVDIYVQFGEVGFNPEDAETIAVSVLDDVVTAFNADIRLGGTCEYCMPVEWDTSYVDRETDTRVLSITIEAKKLETTSI